MGKKLHFLRALSWIVTSVVFISGGSYATWRHWLLKEQNKRKDPAYHIRFIVQTGPQKEALKTTFLAELLGLSADRPLSSLCFDAKKSTQDLLKCPAIQHAHVKLLTENTVYVDYTLRQPIAALYDYENIVFDEEGRLFPLIPFFSPKNLPLVSFDLLRAPLQGRCFELALSILQLTSARSFRLLHIDLSKAFASSYGKREIVLQIEDEVICFCDGKELHFFFPCYLRLTVKNYPTELGNYLKLREQLYEKECRNVLSSPIEIPTEMHMPTKVIDLRIPDLAFIS
jgi:hypothetical protein